MLELVDMRGDLTSSKPCMSLKRSTKFEYLLQSLLRAGSDYGQTLRGEAFGPKKLQKHPKFVLSAFILEAEVQRTAPPK